MNMPVLDEREFSGVDPTPEDQAANAEYFREKGYDLSQEGDPVPAEVAEETPPAEKPAEEPVSPAPTDEIDAETQGEFSAAKNDGEKLGRWAKKNKELRELREKTANADRALAERDARIEELRKQVEAKAAPVANATPLAPPAEVVAEAPKPEPIKAKEFDKPKPIRPKAEDFKESDDPYAALLEANGEYAELLSDWKDEKRDFDTEQKALVARQTHERDIQQTSEQENQRAIAQRLTAAKTAHPDFDVVTNPVPFTPVMQYVLREQLEDGFDLGYQLARPENAEAFKALCEATSTVKDEATGSIQRKINRAISDLAVFRHTLKTKAVAQPVVVETPAPVVEQPKQTPPTPEPRREEAAPIPVRSRGAAAERPEDVPLEDYDRRRELRKRTGTY